MRLHLKDGDHGKSDVEVINRRKKKRYCNYYRKKIETLCVTRGEKEDKSND